MENRVRLRLMGLNYNPLQNGAFALLMAAEGTNLSIPIIIGAPEAQAIAMVIEGINPQRPMTHDLFATFAHAFDIRLEEVFIYSFEDGIFSAEMTFNDGTRRITLDSRTSDAVAIAIRTDAPIFTTRAILEETGIEIVESPHEPDTDEPDTDDNDQSDDPTRPVTPGTGGDKADYDALTDDELREALETAIADDNFEEAAVIQRILDNRNK